MRQIAVPEVLRLVDGPCQAVEACASLGLGGGAHNVLLVTTPTPYEIVGRQLQQELNGDVVLIDDNTYAQVQQVSERLFARDGATVVGVGGGKAIDVAKLAAHYARCRFVSIPTQVSHDGIASPVAVVRHPERGVTSVGATAPEAVIVPMDTVLKAPKRTIRAGVGDLLGKLSALRDWRLAVRAGRDRFDDYAAVLADASVAYLYRHFSGSAGDTSGSLPPSLVAALIHGLLLSGIAMAVAGSSRPCSGSEHLISHAIDGLYGGRALHGEQVAVGTLACLVIQGQREQAVELAGVYRRLGLPVQWGDLGLTDAEFLSVLREAPRTRPERYTVLNERAPSESMLVDIASTLKEAL